MNRILSDLHTHTQHCDGKNTAEEMAAAALAAGLTDYGFSCHGVTPFDLSYSLKNEAGYVQDIRALQTQYAGRLRIYCGVEQDFFAPVEKRERFDYLIASLHYLPDADRKAYYAIDGSPETLASCIRDCFGGDPYRMIQSYYTYVAENVLVNRPDIIGHFDLIVKNNADGRFFDETDARYRKAALESLLACLPLGAPFELNSGAIFRGYRDTPYPANFLLREILQRGGSVCLSSDAHSTAAIGFRFAEGLDLLRAIGFRSVAVWRNGRFEEQGIL